MLHIVYIANGKVWGRVLPVTLNSSTDAQIRALYRDLVISGLDHPDNVVLRGNRFTALIVDSDGKPVFAYSENSIDDIYDLKAEYRIEMHPESAAVYGRVRPGHKEG